MDVTNDFNTADEEVFVPEEIEKLIITAIEAQLKGKSHLALKVGQWVDMICADVIESLVKLVKPFKYVVDCIIMQRNGAGLHATSSCYWDSMTDGLVTVKWPEDRQKGEDNGMYCIVTVFATAL